MLKKLFALGMATIMALGTTMSAFAAEPVNPDPLAEKILVSEERVPVQDEDGNTFYVVISEYVDKEDVKIGTHGIFPEYEVGTKKHSPSRLIMVILETLQVGQQLVPQY